MSLQVWVVSKEPSIHRWPTQSIKAETPAKNSTYNGVCSFTEWHRAQKTTIINKPSCIQNIHCYYSLAV